MTAKRQPVSATRQRVLFKFITHFFLVSRHGDGPIDLESSTKITSLDVNLGRGGICRIAEFYGELLIKLLVVTWLKTLRPQKEQRLNVGDILPWPIVTGVKVGVANAPE